MQHTRAMWETFLPDLVVALVGALVGAVLTVAIAYGTFLLQQARQEKQVVRGLINDLYHRRALAVVSPHEIPNAGERKDFERAGLSVIDIRDHIRRVRDQVRQDTETVNALSNMIRACNRYLEVSEGNPNFYAFLLNELQRDLEEGVTQIAQRMRGVDGLPPGRGAI